MVSVYLDPQWAEYTESVSDTDTIFCPRILWSFERVSICNFGCGHAITATQLPMQCAQCSVSVRVIQGALSIVFALDRAIAA